MSEGDKLMSKAESKVTVSLFRWSPDWEAALPLYEQAAQKYRISGAKGKAAVAYEKASFTQEKLGSPWHAAKHLESAGMLAKESGYTVAEVESFFTRACALYLEAGRGQAGADALSRGGKTLESVNSDAAYRLYMEAVEMYQNEGKDHFSLDSFRAAINLLIRTERFEDAATTQLRFAEACSRTGAKQSQCKAYLSAMIAWLSEPDLKGLPEATNCLQDCLAVDAFYGSVEARAAADLIEAYARRDVEAIQKCIKDDNTFQHLDTSILRLARKLPTGDLGSLQQAPLPLSSDFGTSSLQHQSGAVGRGQQSSPAIETTTDDIDEDNLC
uniref:Gamma-soluble NSF attachment protein n=1 Tax=Pyramimonas obovata TaxID=1411642 RepID=A0A7S0N353_9CHLO|mmetsp:Transcript_18826/g.41212  ORF Transcript_18826/g.41212 Transcript_18826/m.41212 type:complete len:328 (+) Transcript_18826:171-1154(+)|eukprot:CAMPEP_0118922040 /NCGR_PEP_ID=MMETSP1169-20130426/1110_1 /TAXON_ID=36882 /ORGANISM="Pyramimonas obovata, Strain CCMP722" /LENGTH=327 /DNA_ID=CAMNT_0006862853 /DNA_START=171 /DNA_END=1154 /DNA_ORIENTATION=+